jgi:endothelin-converting enzyme
MPLVNASSLTPHLGLTGIIASLAPNTVEVDRVIVTAPQYMKALSSILGETEKDVLQSYFVWKAVQALYGYVDAPAVKPYKRFVNVLAGKVGHLPIGDILLRI